MAAPLCRIEPRWFSVTYFKFAKRTDSNLRSAGVFLILRSGKRWALVARDGPKMSRRGQAVIDKARLRYFWAPLEKFSRNGSGILLLALEAACRA